MWLQKRDVEQAMEKQLDEAKEKLSQKEQEIENMKQEVTRGVLWLQMQQVTADAQLKVSQKQQEIEKIVSLVRWIFVLVVEVFLTAQRQDCEEQSTEAKRKGINKIPTGQAVVFLGQQWCY